MMKTAKIGAIFVISVMALAGTGAAYALWYDYLHLDISVETGYINAEWSVEDAYDSEPPEKDFSSITWELFNDFYGINPDMPGELAQTNGWLWIYINNAYPCIYYTIEFNIENTGTIAIHVEDITYNWNEMPDAAEITITDMAGAPINWPIQIHPGSDNAFYGKMVFHFNNDLEQNTPMTHVICANVMYHQWNEVVG